MERRRLGVLCNHLRPGKEGPLGLSTSNCDGGREEGVKRDGGGCVFCKITRGDSPAFKIYEDDTCMCILDSNPLTCGHSLLIPKKHYPSLEATPPHVVAAMSSKVPFLSNAIMKATGCDSFNLLVNNGAAAGQVIFHTHIHIVPRKAKDKLWKNKSLRRERVELNHETISLMDRIKEHLSLPATTETELHQKQETSS